MGNKENKEHQPDGWISKEGFFIKNNNDEVTNLLKASRYDLRPIYFSPPAKVEVSDEEIALDFGCMANEWANNPNFSMEETVAKLRHLLYKK